MALTTTKGDSNAEQPVVSSSNNSNTEFFRHHGNDGDDAQKKSVKVVSRALDEHSNAIPVRARITNYGFRLR